MTESILTIRVYAKDWKKLKQIFPSKKGESLAKYMERYIEEMKKNERRI